MQNRTGFAADFKCTVSLFSHYIKYRRFSQFVKLFLLSFVTSMQCTFTVKNYSFPRTVLLLPLLLQTHHSLQMQNDWHWFTVGPSALTLLDYTGHVSSLVNFLVLCLY